MCFEFVVPTPGFSPDQRLFVKHCGSDYGHYQFQDQKPEATCRFVLPLSLLLSLLFPVWLLISHHHKWALILRSLQSQKVSSTICYFPERKDRMKRITLQ